MLIPSSSHAGHVCSRGAFALALILSTSAVPALAQTEGFRNTTAPGWQLGDSARLTAAQPNPIDPAGDGWLRLTDAAPDQQGYAFFQTPINPAIGLHVEFEYAIYGGTGGDGLTFFMFDGATPTTSFQIGAPGGSLGYAQTFKLLGGTEQKHGIDKGFLGIGIDSFGDFSNPTEGRSGGPGRVPNAVVFRGPGDSFSDYQYIAGTGTLTPGVGTPAGRPTSFSDPNYRRVIIDVTPSGLLRFTVRVVLQQGQTRTEVIAPTLIPLPGWNAKPANLKFGFAATTSGDGTNIHEVRLFSAAPPVDHRLSKAVQSLTGNTITYTLTATNVGLNADPAARIVDAGPSGVKNQTWTCTAIGGAQCVANGSGPLDTFANLPVGGTVTYTVTSTLTSLVTSPLVNTAAIHASTGLADVNPADNVASTSTPLVGDLVITKAAAPTYTPGGEHVYTIDVVNAGPLAVFGARVTDVFPAGLPGTWSCEVVPPTLAICSVALRSSTSLADVVDLGPGGHVRYTVSIPVPAGHVAPLTNTATVALPPTWIEATPANNTATVTSAAAPRADLTVSKSSNPKPYVPGQPLTYTIVVSNAGPSDVQDAMVSDAFPAPLTDVTWTCAGSSGGVCVAAGSGNLNTPVTLPVGASATYQVVATGPDPVVQLVNTVVVAPPGGVVDPVPGNNTATDANPTLPVADLTITKNGAPNPYLPGQPLTYTVTVTNLGPAAATDARVQDVLPEAIAASASWVCVAGANASCPSTSSGIGSLDALVTMAAGAHVTFTFTATAPAVPDTALTNTATVTAPITVTDPAPGNNSATSTTETLGTANLRIEKSSTPDPYTPGGPITTTIVVSNDGPAEVVNARVLDLPPAGIGSPTWTCTVTAGECGTTSGTGQVDAFVSLPAEATATFVLTATAPLTPGMPIVNTSTVTPPPDIYDPVPGDNDVTDTNSGLPSANLAITKSATPNPYVPGQALTYTITVTNNGPIAATNARVQDGLHPALADFTWTCTGVSPGATCGTASGQGAVDVLVTLPVGGSAQVVVTGVVGIDMRDPITNTATLSPPRGEEDPDPTDNNVSITTPVTALPDLGIEKTAVPSLLYRPGESLSFQLLVTNHGAVSIPANGYTVTDVLPAALQGGAWECSSAPAGTCVVSGGALVASGLPALAPGAQLTITLTTMVPVQASDPLANTATVAITAPGLVDADASNNTASIAMFASSLTAASIVGLVTDGDGSPIPGVVMRLEGAVILETETAADGTYAFPGLPPGHDYIVTPTERGYVFTPATHLVPQLIGEVRADFIGLVEPYVRYYSEGATGEFFRTTYALSNPNGFAANVAIRFQRPTGAEVTHALKLEPFQQIEFDPSTIAGMESTAFSTVVAADRQIITTRTMSWDRSGYGVHRGAGVGTPRMSWYIAEGATLPKFSLFYLLQNPGDTPATVGIRYLLQADGTTPVERTYIVQPRSRYTIGVHDDPALVNQELSAEIISTAPIVVERAMYRSGPRLFEAGAAVTAAPAPASTWFFAEGATGEYFDEFLLLANPGDRGAAVVVQYLLPDGSVITRPHFVPPASRRTIWVEYEDPALANAAVSMRVDASDPIVAERAMWWPGSNDTWTGGHASLGSTNVAPRWGVSGLLAGGPTNAEPWLLVANPGDVSTTIRLTLLFPDGRAPVTADYEVAARSRFTIAVGMWHPETANSSFGAVVEQLGEPTGIIVESAVYQDSGGVVWAAGRGGMASPIP